MDNDKIILFDVFGIAFPLALGKKEKSDTEIIFNLFELVRTYSNLYKTNKVIFCYDGGYDCRRELYPDYKKNRNHNQNDNIKQRINNLYNVLTNFKKILIHLGFNCIRFKGFEADDVIGSIVKNNKNNNFIILANDKDFMQLISKNVTLVLDKKSIEMTPEYFRHKYYGMRPSDYKKVLAISGDRSDNIIGVKNIGESSAIQYIIRSPKLSDKRKILIQENSDLINFNLKLVELPFYTTPNLNINDLQFNKIDKNKMLELFIDIGLYEYIIEDTLSPLWDNFLNNNFE